MTASYSTPQAVRWFPSDSLSNLQKERNTLYRQIRYWKIHGKNLQNPRYLAMVNRLEVMKVKMNILRKSGGPNES